MTCWREKAEPELGSRGDPDEATGRPGRFLLTRLIQKGDAA
jgi:hypothetical protein